MVQALKVIIVVTACHFAAYFVLAKLTPHGDKLRQYLIAVVMIVSTAVLTRNPLIAYVVTVFISYFFTRGATNGERVALFFGLAFCLSFFDGFALNFGMNFGGLSLPKVLMLTVLVPMFFLRKPDSEIRRFNAIDKAVIIFFIWWMLLGFRGANMSSIMRSIVWSSVEYIITYIVIRRYLSNYSLAFAAISFALMSQALVGFVEAILRWHVYTDVERIANWASQANAQYKFRWGFLRAQASFMNPLVFVLFANMAFLAAFIHFTKTGMEKPPRSYSRFWAFLGLGIGLLGTLSTGSRAGIAGSVLITLMMIVLLWALNKRRDPKRLLISTACIGLLLVFTVGGDLIRENFDYRWRLFNISTSVILAEPFVGLANPTADPRMASLIQGEGIVDLVNTYLSIALHNGLPGLILFMYAIFGGLSRLYDSLRKAEGEKLTFGVFCFTSLLLLAFNIATTSTMGWSYLWIWILLAISSNIIARVQAESRPARPSLIDAA